MNNYKVIDLESWIRKEHFEYYQSFDSPCFNISVNINAEKIYAFAKSNNHSFFLICLYAIARAANMVPQFKQRVLDGKVIEYEKIAVMTPIMTEHEMFCQAWCEYYDNFLEFKAAAEPKIQQAKHSHPAPMKVDGEDFICASCSPWIHFTGMSQAKYKFSQSIPILAWGKLENGKIPFSIQVDHSFIDGYFVSKFFDQITYAFENPDLL